MKPVIHSAVAAHDVRNAADYYANEADTELAADFIDAIEHAVQNISLWPGIGSPRFSELLSIPDLRTLSLNRFPYIIFYIEFPEHIIVWRVLHAQRDILDLLR